MTADRKDDLARAYKMTRAEIVEMRDRYGAKHYGTEPDFIPDHGDGVWLWDVRGKKYLDMNATYSAIAAGHRNLELKEAIDRQLLRFTSTQNKFPTAVQSLLLKRICLLTGQDRAILMNTGAEAVDTAVKAARRWAYKVKGVYENSAKIFTAHDNFHGRTLNAIGMSSVEKYREDFGPFPPGYVKVPFGDIKALDAAFSEDRNGAAFIVEPIQGEGGINLPPPGYLERVRRLCNIYGILLIFDEVQTGLGRTGKLFAYEHYGVNPDAIILGKALGGYMPVSAVAGVKELMDVFTPGSHGSTFGGNALSCATALTSLELITRDDYALVENSAVVGEYLLKKLLGAGLNARGKGLFIGVELDGKRKKAEAAFHELLRHGIIAGAASNEVVRFTPPLNFTKKLADFAAPTIVNVLK